MEAERHKGRLVTVVVVVVVSGLAMLGIRWWQPDDSDSTAAQAAFATGLKRLPVSERGSAVSLSGETLDGDPLDIAEWRGDVVVVNVWGSWCGPCRKEAPALARVSKATKSLGVHFLGIDVRDNLSAAKAFTRSYGIEYPSLFDADGTLVLAFSGRVPVSAVPSTIVLDRQGRVAATVIGVVDETTLRGLVDDVLAEADDRSAREE